MPLTRLAQVLDAHVQGLESAGTAKGAESVVTGVRRASGDKGPRFLLEGEGEREFIRMNSNSYLGMGLRDEVIEAHRQLTDRIHAHGARIQPQLVHPGPDGLAPYLSGQPNLGPSVIPSYLTGIPCRELAADELPAIVERFAAAAARIRIQATSQRLAKGALTRYPNRTPTRVR